MPIAGIGAGTRRCRDRSGVDFKLLAEHGVTHPAGMCQRVHFTATEMSQTVIIGKFVTPTGPYRSCGIIWWRLASSAGDLDPISRKGHSEKQSGPHLRIHLYIYLHSKLQQVIRSPPVNSHLTPTPPCVSNRKKLTKN